MKVLVFTIITLQLHNILSNTLKTKVSSGSNANFLIKNSYLQETMNLFTNKKQPVEKRSFSFKESQSNLKQEESYLNAWWMIQSDDYILNYPTLVANESKINIPINNDKFRINKATTCMDPLKPPGELWFLFRLNDKKLWYSSTMTDMNILDTYELSKIYIMKDFQINYDNRALFCSELIGDYKKWKICHFNEEIFNKWTCKIKVISRIDDFKCHSTSQQESIRNTVEIVKPELIIPLPSKFCNENWNYSKNGDDWECNCSDGVEQSPINLPKIENTILSPVKPLFSYDKINNKVKKETISLINNNYIQIIGDSFGKVITLDGTVYKAKEITFHTPSNHHIDGQQFELEISIIHYGISKGDINKQVVLSFLFKKKAGYYNKFIENIDYTNLPNKLDKMDFIGEIFIPQILFNTSDNEPTDDSIQKKISNFSFYTYEGSLSFPPCTERTINYVASEPLFISPITLELFKEALSTNNKKKNLWSNRSTQKLNNRPIYYYDHLKNCGADTNPELNIESNDSNNTGHYEKIPRDITKYFYVNSKDPSGIPNSQVITEEEAKESWQLTQI